MNKENIEFLDEKIKVPNEIIKAFLETVILDDEKFEAIYYLSDEFITEKNNIDFIDDILLLTNKRIISLIINSKSIIFENYLLNIIKGFKIVKDYSGDVNGTKSTNFINEVKILLRNTINEKDYLEVKLDEKNKKFSIEIQKSNAFEFVKELSKLIF